MRARGLIIGVMAMILMALLAWGYPRAELTIPPSEITFSHRFHVQDVEAECLTCHESATESTKSSDRLLPTMDVCGECHDVEDDETCGMCHQDEEYEALANPPRTIEFNHSLHIGQGTDCATCHGEIGSVDQATVAENMPKMSTCFSCHGDMTADATCDKCHSDGLSLLDIHPAGWLHKHSDQAVVEPEWCMGCHRNEAFCLDCHRGDNVTGSIHDLNYAYTHGLDAAGKERDCARCHDRKAFCIECHEANNRIPLKHSSLSWATNHGREAREDIENCASCHETGDPTCARVGCHNDADGMRGTDPPIHDAGTAMFDSHGAWHSDDGAFCFDCHMNTRTAGTGFCGYCHGAD